MDRKIVRYVGVIIIGTGFIMMAACNALNSQIASILQAILGALFIVMAIVKIIAERDKKD